MSPHLHSRSNSSQMRVKKSFFGFLSNHKRISLAIFAIALVSFRIYFACAQSWVSISFNRNSSSLRRFSNEPLLPEFLYSE